MFDGLPSTYVANLCCMQLVENSGLKHHRLLSELQDNKSLMIQVNGLERRLQNVESDIQVDEIKYVWLWAPVVATQFLYRILFYLFLFI